MQHPSSTYRIQFHKGFNFNDFEKIIPYLHKLGVQTIYASPIFKAIPGSTHGYDGVDPTQINPEIGTEEQLFKISDRLKKLGIGWLQDIVPNHMAFHPDNAWLMDVLANGEKSAYANFFDIGAFHSRKKEQIMVPFLGGDLAEAIGNKTVQVVYQDEKFWLNDGTNNWPLNTQDLELEAINADSNLLVKLLDAQYYRLCNWEETNEHINYRRFFTVNALICLNIQDQNVFNAYHRYTFDLIAKGVFQGLRIDHVDGLFDPTQYLTELRAAIGPDCYLVVEKILHHQEHLPRTWPIEGSTGYDFLAMVNNLLTNKRAEPSFDHVYEQVIGKNLIVDEQALLKKSTFLHQHMGGELDNLYQLFLQLHLANEAQLKTLPEESLKSAIADFLVYCPVYRFYGNSFPLNASEKAEVEAVFASLDAQSPNRKAYQLLKDVLLGSDKKACLFYQRCMQFSGPLAAKGIEDTLMYTYNRFIGHDEVGDAPDLFGMTIAEFHRLMIARQQQWPLALNATSTHDTKRGEDVRARLNVLTDIPAIWKKVVDDLEEVSATLQNASADFKDLHKNDLYLIYQTIFGIWPMPGQSHAGIADRLALYIEKALREAKKRSDWATPNEDYEQLVKLFVQKFLNYPNRKNAVINSFVANVADFGIINSLSQVVLKFTCPGIPDCYQGTELWDLSLVDPDNRREVDYRTAKQLFEKLSKQLSISQLWQNRYAGEIKLWLTHRLLELRKAEQLLFTEGDYLPLQCKGRYAAYVFAFARKLKNEWVITIVPLGQAALCDGNKNKLVGFDWKDTLVQLPDDAPSIWENILTQEKHSKDIHQEGILVKNIWKELPIAVLKKVPSDRGSGILLHISSLPSSFGIGDLGPAAYNFVDFLKAAKQKYWQLLPLNPIDSAQYYSPYSATSSMAGNVLFISSQELKDLGLLTSDQLSKFRCQFQAKLNYFKAEKLKNDMLSLAYQNFVHSGDHDLLKKEFTQFCEQEKEWLTADVLYQLIKQLQQGKPWDQWPTDFKMKDALSLKKISTQHQAKLTELKWRQFIFDRQWQKLRQYADSQGICIIGDIPFYVAYDSVDVWMNPSLFRLDNDLKIKYSAGVPPDYFNASGQLWCMPTYNWKAHKAQKYKWWIDRLRQNLKFFDQIRLDHFRAFESYWEVEARQETAINGVWKRGPGYDILSKLKKEFPDMPFIAEDLGSIGQAVLALRDAFGLFGMKVLQFAFEDDMVISPHATHQFAGKRFIVYPGTHDNNTIKGWYKSLSALQKKRLNDYTGRKVTLTNAHLVLMQLAFSSTAKICIVQLQDLLGLDETTRLNTPASISNNWTWRINGDKLDEKINAWLRKQTEMYGRD